MKAGLCKDVASYKYSSYSEYLGGSDFIDSDFVFEIIPFETFQQAHEEVSNKKCLEIDEKTIVRVTDEQAKKIIYKYSKCDNVAAFQRLKEKQRDKYIKEFRKKGLSIRQISRLTGVSFGLVRKMINT